MRLLQGYSLSQGARLAPHLILVCVYLMCICVVYLCTICMYLCVFDEAIRRTEEGGWPGGGKDPTKRLKQPINTPLAHSCNTKPTCTLTMHCNAINTPLAMPNTPLSHLQYQTPCSTLVWWVLPSTAPCLLLQDVMIICGG